MNVQPPPPAINRRAVQRRALRQVAAVIQGDVEWQATTWDVSTNGLCLLTRRPVTPGSRWQVRFDLPLADQTMTFTVHVKVVYSSYTGPSGFKIGTVFIDLADDVADTIREFMATT